MDEFRQNDFDGAIADATHAIDLEPKLSNAFGTRGWARYGKGDTSGALDDCKRSVELARARSADTSLDQGMIDFINGDYEKAAVSWQKYVECRPVTKRDIQPWIDRAKAAAKEKSQN